MEFVEIFAQNAYFDKSKKKKSPKNAQNEFRPSIPDWELGERQSAGVVSQKNIYSWSCPGVQPIFWRNEESFLSIIMELKYNTIVYDWLIDLWVSEWYLKMCAQFWIEIINNVNICWVSRSASKKIISFDLKMWIHMCKWYYFWWTKKIFVENRNKGRTTKNCNFDFVAIRNGDSLARFLLAFAARNYWAVGTTHFALLLHFYVIQIHHHMHQSVGRSPSLVWLGLAFDFGVGANSIRSSLRFLAFNFRRIGRGDTEIN